MRGHLNTDVQAGLELGTLCSREQCLDRSATAPLIKFNVNDNDNEPLRTCHRFKFGLISEESVYKELRNLKSKKSAGLDEIPLSVLKDAANILSGPLCHIINMSFTDGIFPTNWKRSKLIPTYKSGKKDCIENYIPISVIPTISKVIEKLVHRQLSDYLERNNFLKDCQFGFRSTELTVTLCTDKIKKNVDEGKIVGAIFIDLTKAFDTLSHTKIITKLQSYGVDSIELKWFQDYLFNRT